MKTYKLYILGWMLLGTLTTRAQNSIDQVLKSIETNNKSLQANTKMTDAQKLEAQTGKFLANPSVEWEQMWGNRNNPGSEYTLTVKQSLDFPTTYSNKNKLANLKANTIGFQSAAYRQQLLLNAKQTCIEIIYLRKQKSLLDERLANAETMFALYKKRFESGDANQLELNKIQLELLNAQNQSRLNKAALTAAEEQLRNFNGGNPITFDATDYPTGEELINFDQLQAAFMEADPNLKSLTGDQEIANREVKLSRSLTLPKFDVGYKRNAAKDHVASNGFMVGVSIPLFENKNTVKKAKAQAEFATASLEDNRLNLKTNLQQLYQQAEALQISRADYAKVLEQQRNIELLNKALNAGQLSVIDYFTELTTIYDSHQSYLDVEKEYHSILAQLYQYKL
ncbi:MAG: TolC family protein [Butyricimonas faecihominis]|uniref:Outer membrane protein TolC n=1 Tax=Butyricimonas faecihominis TaxID=1472416 RepID=A0A7W6HY25_9BACT|nr:MULTISPECIES: TolC family protein [Butyricimonas]MBS6686600.1 TolC family protein [Sanguibacteroides justesenii]KAB1506403.1 TolC family protein [Butyricimonas faecihominis]MBB4027070.1 outer membrane protein TolC [Butyricimonas faecihominis]WOF09353.1 TolC family protein [Butyricimonas faecihominis]BEI58368.1 TolC family protein [Butyricimonas faecihominis]